MSEYTVTDYLKLPYARVLVPDPASGLFSARMLEFPGCFAVGETATEAYDNLEAAAASWIESCLERNIPVPEPLASRE